MTTTNRPLTMMFALTATATLSVLSMLSMFSMAPPAEAQIAAPMPAPVQVQARNVVLVHGAWADGSSWSAVIPILQAAGLHVTAVQNPHPTEIAGLILAAAGRGKVQLPVAHE